MRRQEDPAYAGLPAEYNSQICCRLDHLHLANKQERSLSACRRKDPALLLASVTSFILSEGLTMRLYIPVVVLITLIFPITAYAETKVNIDLTNRDEFYAVQHMCISDAVSCA